MSFLINQRDTFFDLLSTRELIIIWIFIIIDLLYLFSFVFMLVMPSFLGDNRKQLIVLAVFALLGSLALTLKRFGKINEYVLLVMAIAYLVLYIIGAVFVFRKKRETDKAADRLIALQRERKMASEKPEKKDK